jgi:hypothetical protein
VWKGPRIFSSTTLIPLALVSTVAAARIALSDGIAFRATREQLLVSGVWTKRRVAWSDVLDITLIRETRTSRGEPISPGSTMYLVFKVAKARGGEEDIRLQYEMFRDMPPSEGPGLVERLRAMKQASAPVATRRMIVTPDGQGSCAFGKPDHT